MKKPNHLRAAIAELLPETARDPDRLAMWVERGSMRATINKQRGFSWEYDLIIVAENFAEDPAALFFIVVEWLRTQQPDLLAPNAEGIPFEVNVIDDSTVDVRITLSLREIVTVELVGGKPRFITADEPAPMFPDEVSLRDYDGPISSIWARGNGETFKVAPDE